jgi:hypothetical protein
MTVVSHEREPGELGYVARYAKMVNDLARRVRADPAAFGSEQVVSSGGPWWKSKCCDGTSSGACPTGSTGSNTVPRDRSTSC